MLLVKMQLFNTFHVIVLDTDALQKVHISYDSKPM